MDTGQADMGNWQGWHGETTGWQGRRQGDRGGDWATGEVTRRQGWPSKVG